MADRRAEVLAELVVIRDKLAEHNQVVADLYARRLRLWAEAREEMDPPMLQRLLADASGVGEVAVIAGLRKKREQEAATA